MYAYEVHARKMHDYEVHAYEMHVYEICAYEMTSIRYTLVRRIPMTARIRLYGSGMFDRKILLRG